MIIRKYYATREDGVDLYITNSDQGLKIHKVGTDEIYDSAIDVENAPFTYAETDIPIEPAEPVEPDTEAGEEEPA